jgi:hypothetical protein
MTGVMTTIDRPSQSAGARVASLMPQQRVCEAVASRRLVGIWYDQGGWRLVEAFVHGWTAEGFELLGAFQCDGNSESGCPTGWKTFFVDRIVAVEVLHDVRLIGAPTTDYSPPTGLARVHCQAGLG